MTSGSDHEAQRRPGDGGEPRRIVVMGVSGAGKSTVGSALATAIGAAFMDADDLHDDHARTKMADGIPLTDSDREPWLRRVGGAMDRVAALSPVVVACSALRARYRRIIEESAGGPVWFVHLDLDEDSLRSRLSERAGHFMPVSLLHSQLDTLEPLAAGELGTTVNASQPVTEIVAHVREAL